jgi:hypothetical protein
MAIASYLVRLMSGSRSHLALLTGRELGKITVVVTLPVGANILVMHWPVGASKGKPKTHILW